MTSDTYINDRLDNQQKWHSVKSDEYKKKYHAIKTTEIILCGIVSVASFYKNSELSLFSSIIMTGLVSFDSLKRYKELWLSYRVISEKLKQEKIFFKTKAEIYTGTDEDNFKLLVNRCEVLLSEQNLEWVKKTNTNPKQPAAV